MDRQRHGGPGPDQGRVCRCRPPGASARPGRADGAPVPQRQGSLRSGFANSGASSLVLPLTDHFWSFFSLFSTRFCRAIWGVDPKSSRRKASIFDVETVSWYFWKCTIRHGDGAEDIRQGQLGRQVLQRPRETEGPFLRPRSGKEVDPAHLAVPSLPVCSADGMTFPKRRNSFLSALQELTCLLGPQTSSPRSFVGDTFPKLGGFLGGLSLSS